MPIASALSMEQITRRSWMVRSSTLARETLMSPATTSPLSRILSRMSTNPCGWRGSIGMARKDIATTTQLLPHLYRSELKVEVVISEPECPLQLVHFFFELHQRGAQFFDLVVAEIAGVHATQRLLLQQAADQFNDGEHELRESVLDDLRIGGDALGNHRIGECELLAERRFVIRHDHLQTPPTATVRTTKTGRAEIAASAPRPRRARALLRRVRRAPRIRARPDRDAAICLSPSHFPRH